MTTSLKSSGARQRRAAAGTRPDDFNDVVEWIHGFFWLSALSSGKVLLPAYRKIKRSFKVNGALPIGRQMALATDIRVATKIDADDFDAARKDAKVKDLVRDARKYGADLRKSGKDHSLTPSGS